MPKSSSVNPHILEILLESALTLIPAPPFQIDEPGNGIPYKEHKHDNTQDTVPYTELPGLIGQFNEL